MFVMIEKAVFIMVLLRLVSGSIEILAAALMFKLNNIEKALIVNSSLALIGPIILIVSTSVGLLGISEKVSFAKMICIFTGVVLILVGIKVK
ncbi:YqhV family protein [Virgibacillus sp. DJP39]|uniref:YqhV family protein n=1 Tax=Virgibacillus sp. DJP39 TaxID=3409790 RepID=UPI003BB5B848